MLSLNFRFVFVLRKQKRFVYGKHKHWINYSFECRSTIALFKKCFSNHKMLVKEV